MSEQRMMKALVYEGPSVMNMRTVEVPQAIKDEAIIKVERVGICGSELGGFLGHNSLRKPPLVMGHEFSGTIVELNSEAGVELQVGDRVTVNPLVTCGQCSACHSGHAQLCANRKLVGAAMPGGFAEYVSVPLKSIHRLPDHVSFDQGAFTEPFACAVHICRLLKLNPTDRLLITGAGPIGLFTLQAAKVYGLQNIVVTDINAERLEIVEELGGIPLHSQDLEREAEGSFDVSVDAAGVGATRQACVRFVKLGGRVLFTGLHEADSELPINTAIRNELVMMGAFAYNPIDFEIALKWISEQRVDLLPWTTFEPLENGQACFEKLIKNPGKTAKIMLTLP